MSNTNLRYLRIVTAIFLLTSFGFGPTSLNAAELNLIKNPSFETAGTNSNPADWTRENWGTPAPTFKYPDTGRDGVGKSASITYSQSTSGGAYWGHSVVAVKAGESYTYSNWFKSDIATEIDAEFTNSSGRLSYILVTVLPSTSGAWRQTTSTIKIPTGITKMTVFHLIEAKGTLAVDDFSLVKVGATSTPPTSTTTPPTATTTPPTATSTPPTSTTTTPTLTLTALPTTIQKGATSTLTWVSTNTTTCNSLNSWTTSHATSGSQGVAPTATRIYAMTCLGGGTSVSKQVTVTVTSTTTATTTPPTPPPAPTLTLTATPTNIKLGATSTISWVSTNTTICSALNGWSAITATSSSQAVSPTATTTYEMSCFGAGGTTTKQAIVSVTLPPPPPPLPTLTFTANPTTIKLEATSTLSWVSTNTTSCSALNTWTTSTSTSGSQVVSPSATTTYEMSCFGAGGTTTAQATVSVIIPPLPPPPPSNPELFDKGIVTFTFDDGLKSAFDHMNLLGSFKSTQYIYTEPMFGATLCNGACYEEFMSIADVKSLYNAGHEIASHTRSHPDLTTVSAVTKLYEIDGARLDLLNQIGIAVTNLAYPYGALDNTIIDKLKSAGYGGARTVFPDELNTKLTNRYSLFARQVNSDVSVAIVRGWIDEAITTKKWLILVFHEVRTDCSGELYCATPSTLTGIVNYLSSVGNNANVLTVAQGLALMNNNPVSKPGIPSITQANITTTRTSSAGASVVFSPQVTDDDLGLPAPLAAFCTIPNDVEDPFSGLIFPTVVTSGYTFPIGTTPVTCTAADAGGRVGTKTFNVVVN